jgi:predicted TIM-barrel fold metal-dependent hydrolase
MRIAAFQALEKLDPDWARDFVPRSGLSEADLQAALAPLDRVADCRWARQRRYRRIRLSHPLPAVATSEREVAHLEIKGLSLGGGLGGFDRHVPSGAVVILKLGSGRRSIHAQAIVRGARAHGLGFEFLEMELEERAKLRRLLASEPAALSETSE